MNGNSEFIAYCLEEYKTARGMTGKEVITLFKKYNIIDYIVSCYGALHTMGGLAIAEDIDSLIEDMKRTGGTPMIEPRHDENLLVVFAVEEYARRYGISAHETLGIFLKFGITESIRQCYETLHTQDIYECVSFAEDILKRKNV